MYVPRPLNVLVSATDGICSAYGIKRTLRNTYIHTYVNLYISRRTGTIQLVREYRASVSVP